MLYYCSAFIHLTLLILYGETLPHLASASRTPTSGLSSLFSDPVRLYNQNTTTARPSYPAKSPDDPGKVCFIGDCAKYPNATLTMDQRGGSNDYTPNTDMEQLCVLWNSSCSGNITLAKNEFFDNGTAGILTSNECFIQQPTDPSERNGLEGCYQIESPQRLLRFGQAKKWMRSPQCLSDAAVWVTQGPDRDFSNYLPHPDLGRGNCCAKCDISVQNVDIYYWPEVDVDTSCLDIIGASTNPLTSGATTTIIEYNRFGESSSSLSYSTYWGCIGQDSTITTTAYMTQINSVTFKASSYNPWLSPPCPEKTRPVITSNASIAARGEQASIRARAHSLIIQPNITQNNGLLMSTLTIDNFTFTSPSIYANFHSIVGQDGCGTPIIIPQTMLTFSPGELSSIAGPITDCNIDYCSFSTRAYNFRDLPCPPQSVMEENWYKPQPGEPYRPLVALPKQIKKLNPFFKDCEDYFFTGFDPPKTLAPAAALTPIITTENPEAFTPAPKPSPTPDAGAKKTTNNEPPLITPVDSPAVGEPQKPDSQVSNSMHKPSDPENGPKDSRPWLNLPAQPGPDPNDLSGNPQQGNNANTILGEENNSSPSFISVPPIDAAVSNKGSNQRTDPAMHGIPPPGGNADPAVGEAVFDNGKAEPNRLLQFKDAAKTVESPEEWNPSNPDPPVAPDEKPQDESPGKFDPTVGGIRDPKGKDPPEIDPPNEAIENLGKGETNRVNPSSEAIGESGKGAPSTLDPSNKAIVQSEKGDPNTIGPAVEAQRGPEHDNPEISGQSNYVTGDSDKVNPNVLDSLFKPLADPEIESSSNFSPSLEDIEGSGGEKSRKHDPPFGGSQDQGKNNPSRLNSAIKPPGDPETDNSRILDPSSETTGQSSKENPNKLVSSLGDPGEEDPSKFGLPSDVMKDYGTKSPSKLGALIEATREEDLTKLDSSLETGTTSKSHEDSEQQDDLHRTHDRPQAKTKLLELFDDFLQESGLDHPHPNDAPANSHPFHISPSQILRMEAAHYSSAQQAQVSPESAQNEYYTSNEQGAPGYLRVFGHRPQVKTYPESPSSQATEPSLSSVNGHAITATRTAPSDTLRSALPSASTAVSVNGTLDGAKKIAGSGNEDTGTVSAVHTDSSGGKVDTNMGRRVQMFKWEAWVALAILILVCMS